MVDEFRKEHLADRATAAFFYHQQLSLLHAGRKGARGGGHQPSDGTFEAWHARVTGNRADVHGEADVLAPLRERFLTLSLSYGPYLFRHGLDTEVEPLERKLIAEGGIQATGLRWVGVLEAGSQKRER